MKRILRLGIGLLAVMVGALLASAEGPDDLFVRVYNLIQQADVMRAAGQLDQARLRYQEARAMLDQLQATYPSWNPKIIKYRRNYIDEQMATPPSSEPPPPTTAPAPPTEQASPTPDEKPAEPPPRPAEQVGSLMIEIGNLRAERDALQARLREALSVQPAAADPRELAKVEQRLQEVLAENASLKASLDGQPAKPGAAADSATPAETRKAVKEAQSALKRQTKAVETLTKERDALREQLKRANDKAQARAAREQAKTGQSAPQEVSPRATDQPVATPEFAAQLKQAQDALEAERRRSEVLQAEKAALENRLASLPQSPTNAPPAQATTPEAVPAVTPPPPKPRTAREIKAERATDKAVIKQLERERDDLRKRVAMLSRQLEDRKVRSGTAQQDRVAEELAILRARIQVYEARQVPYTPEELAQFQPGSTAGMVSEVPTSKRAARQVPAGAATLVAEAQRAFQGRRFDEAEKKFQQALVLDDKNVGLLTFLAATYLEQGQLEPAEATLNRAIAQDPNDAEILSLLGILRFRQAKYDEAMDILSRAAQYNPDNALTQNYLGVTLNQKGQRGPAERAFRRALQLEPNYADAHFNLALVYTYQKPPFVELARWHYQKALAGGHAPNPEIEKLLDAAGKSGSAR